MHFAAERRNIKVMEVLIQYGASVTLRNKVKCFFNWLFDKYYSKFYFYLNTNKYFMIYIFSTSIHIHDISSNHFITLYCVLFTCTLT